MIIFMGVAGSGKSVQGRLLADKLNLPWLSTGEFLRMLVSGETRQAMMNGQLLEDHEIIELVRKIFAMINTRQQFILDGFPRTISQADWLLNEAKHKQLQITAVVNIEVSREVVAERLLGRGRPDDHEQAIKERFVEYDKAILPILDDFRKNGVQIFDVDGDRSVNEVHQDILGLVGQVIGSSES